MKFSSENRKRTPYNSPSFLFRVYDRAMTLSTTMPHKYIAESYWPTPDRVHKALSLTYI